MSCSSDLDSGDDGGNAALILTTKRPVGIRETKGFLLLCSVDRASL